MKKFNAKDLAAVVTVSAVISAAVSFGVATYHTEATPEVVSTPSKKEAGASSDVVAAKTSAEEVVTKPERSAQNSIENDDLYHVNDDGYLVYGPRDATVSVYTFSDFKCSYCARFDPAMKYIVDNGGGYVNFVYRPFPILGPASTMMAEAAQCVARMYGPKAFWEFSESLYATKNWRISASRTNMESQGDIQECISSGKYSGEVQSSIADGEKLGVTGTPASVIRNNETESGIFVPGYVDQEQMIELIKEA